MLTLRKSETKDEQAKDEENDDNVKKDEAGSDEDNDGSSLKKKEDAEAVEVRDVSYQLEILDEYQVGLYIIWKWVSVKSGFCFFQPSSNRHVFNSSRTKSKCIPSQEAACDEGKKSQDPECDMGLQTSSSVFLSINFFLFHSRLLTMYLLPTNQI